MCLCRAGRLIKLIQKGDFDIESGPWSKISDNAKDLIKKMLTVDPSKRLSAKEVLKHKWITKEKKRSNLLQEVVQRMTIRKTLREQQSVINRRMSNNMYPKGDL